MKLTIIDTTPGVTITDPAVVLTIGNDAISGAALVAAQIATEKAAEAAASAESLIDGVTWVGDQVQIGDVLSPHLTGPAGEVTAAQLADGLATRKPYHGFQAGGKPYVSAGNLIVPLSAGEIVYWFAGVKYRTTSDIVIPLGTLTADVQYFVYFTDALGTAVISSTPWDIEYTKVMAATVTWNGATRYEVGNELHGYERSLQWHKSAHKTYGTQFESGGAIVSAASTFSVAAFSIWDEDINNATSGNTTTARMYYRKNGVSDVTFADALSAYLYRHDNANGAPVYDDGDGTPGSVGTGNYACYWLYFTNDANAPVAVILGRGSYNTLALAQAELKPALVNRSAAEWRLAYKLYYRNVGGTATLQSTATEDYRAVSTGVPTSGGTISVTASSVAFTPSGSIASTNAQTAIEELDTEKVALAGNNVQLVAATGNEVAYTLDYTTNKATSGNDTGLRIKMTDTASPGTSCFLECYGSATGTVRYYFITASGTTYQYGNLLHINTAAGMFFIPNFDTHITGTVSRTSFQFFNTNQENQCTAGTQVNTKIYAKYNQPSGTAANTDLLIERTETAIGSGLQRLISATVGGVEKFGVDNLGRIFSQLSLVDYAQYVPVSGSVTCTLGKHHIVTGAGPRIIYLPGMTAAAGGQISIEISASYTGTLTIDSNGNLIDGVATRVMWASETVTLVWTGSTWTKIAGKSIPLIATLSLATSQSINSLTETKVNLDTATVNSLDMCDTTNKQINCRRSGKYIVSLAGAWYSTSGAATRRLFNIYAGVSGNVLAVTVEQGNYAGAMFPGMSGLSTISLSAGDYAVLKAYHSYGSAQSVAGANNSAKTSLTLTEIITW